MYDQLFVSEVQVYCEDHFNYMTTLSEFMPIYKPITFLDGGSNTGMAAILFSHAMMGNGEVLAVEAHPDTFEVCSCVILQSVVRIWIAQPVNTVEWPPDRPGGITSTAFRLRRKEASVSGLRVPLRLLNCTARGVYFGGVYSGGSR